LSGIDIFEQDGGGAPRKAGTIPWADRVRIDVRTLLVETVALTLDTGRAAADRPVEVTEHDREALIRRALEGFEQGRVLVLAGDRRLVSIDDVVEPGARVIFVRLLPLGGC
jgi:hypothetical protein